MTLAKGLLLIVDILHPKALFYDETIARAFFTLDEFRSLYSKHLFIHTTCHNSTNLPLYQY